MDFSTHAPITLATQGSFAIGGSVIADDKGDSVHIDHAYIQYQIPVNARRFPLVMWHGGGQFSKTWESTPDGRDGYQNIFLRRGFSTYILDQPRRGRSGRGAAECTIPAATPLNANVYNIFRLGSWLPPKPPEFFPNVQFPRDAESLSQYWRQIVMSTGAEERNDKGREIMYAPVVALLAKIGPAILLTHSNSGQYGWLTHINSPNVKAIVSYEPGSFVFPADAKPTDVPTSDPLAAALADPILVRPEDFAKLTKIPIQLVYGDNIETGKPSPITGVELWRVNAQRARQFCDAINARGGQARILRLPDAGLRGNTHFPFSDLNNIAVADLLSEFLKAQGLDTR